MNSPMVIEAARKLVDRPIFAELKTDDARVTALYIAIFQRMPTQARDLLKERGLRGKWAHWCKHRVNLSARCNRAPYT